MRLLTFGLGGTAALVLTLGLGSAPPPQGGSYTTLGYGQTASKVAMLGLTPHAPIFEGSYVTLGQGQSASKFAMLGLRPGAAVPPVVVDHGGGGVSIRIPIDDRLRRYSLQRDDELLLLVAAAFVTIH